MTGKEIMRLATLVYKNRLKPTTGCSIDIDGNEACFLGAACYQKVKGFVAFCLRRLSCV